MKNSDKSPTVSSEVLRSDQKREAIQHFRKGLTPSAFAAKHGIARTTVIGWQRKWAADREATVIGRPRKLAPYNETEVLGSLLKTTILQGWQDVKKLIRENSGERVGKRSIYRLMRRWGLSSLGRNSEAGMFLLADQWIQPADTVGGSGNRQRATIWRLLSGRGMEGFIFTDDESVEALETVAGEVVKVMKRRRPQQLRTNHKLLAETLANKLPRWKIHSTSD